MDDTEKITRILMREMGCQIQSDEPDCDDDPHCRGHEQFTYCAVHDWDDDWVDWKQGRLCLYVKGLATALVKEGVR